MPNGSDNPTKACPPTNDGHAFYYSQGIKRLEAEAFDDWPQFLHRALTYNSSDDNPSPMVNQNTLPFEKVFTPFTQLFLNEITLYLKNKPFKLSTVAYEQLINGITRDYIEACGLTLYCTIEDEKPDRNLVDYDAWVTEFYRNRWPSFTAEYTVLGILLKQRYDQYFHHCCEVFDRLEEDLELLQETFGHKINTISQLQFRLADRHNHGRNVCKFEFDDTLNIIYKPKPLINELWIQNLISNNIGFNDSAIGRYTVLNRGNYGWAQFIKPDVHLEHDINGIIESYSSLLALLYLINASDMHTENALICNNKFYPIDVETIFNPSTVMNGYQSSWRDYSIFFTGMLFDDLDSHLARPDANTNYFANDINQNMYRILNDQKKGVFLQMLAPNKDKESAPFQPSKLNESEWLIFAENTKKKILEYQKHLLLSGDFNEADLVCRHVPRNTAFYARIQQVLYHPHKLKNFKDWETYISQLLETVDLDENLNAINQLSLVNSEIEQLKRGDIPYFTFKNNSKDLLADNTVISHNFFEETGKATIEKKLHEFGESDAEEIKNLLIAKYITWNQMPCDLKSEYPAIEKKSTLQHTRKEILYFSKNIAETIILAANVSEGNPARWLSHEGDVTNIQASHISGNYTFYNGYWGILAFLMQTEKNLPSDEASLIKEFIDREMKIWFSDNRPQLYFSIIGFGGLAGSIAALNLIDEIYHDSKPIMFNQFYGDGIAIRKALNKKFDEKNFSDLDYMSGKLGLFTILNKTKNTIITDTLLTDSLNAFHANVLTHWDRYISKRDKALIGFAHGISALISHLANTLNCNKDIDTRLANELLDKVWAYDLSCRVAESGLWSDNRHADITPLNRSWCHGLSGVGMSRLSLLKIDKYRDESFKDLNAIIHKLGEKTHTSGFQHLCCGDCGEIDFLIEASKIEAFQFETEKLINQRYAALIQHIGNGQFFCGTVGKLSTSIAPDLFQGAAGIGYTLLRLKDNNLPTAY